MDIKPETYVKTFSDIVRGDLKNAASPGEKEKLRKNVIEWKAELIRLKLSCEAQMVSSNAKRFQIHKDWLNNVITHEEYLDKIEHEKTWKCNAALFLQKIETKIQEINSDIV